MDQGSFDEAGLDAQFQTFPIRTLLEPSGQLVAGDAKVGVFPQWLPPANSLGKTIEAPFVSLDADKGGPSIRMLTKPAPLSGNWGAAQDALVTEAMGKGAQALVLAPDDRAGELYVSNQHNPEPFPIPVVLVARRALAELAGLADRKDLTARLTISGKLADTNAINVVARKPGRGRMLVISTPLTGWFHCGGERGPGVAVLLRMAGLLARSERPVLVLGSGSHEIGHYGMEHFLQHGAPAPAEVAFWIHFGASLAATKLDARYGTTSPKYLVGTKATEEWVRAALATHMPNYMNGNSRTPGESGQVIGAGHTRFAGMVGTFPTFHTPADKGEVIDFAQLEQLAEACASLIRRFSETTD